MSPLGHTICLRVRCAETGPHSLAIGARCPHPSALLPAGPPREGEHTPPPTSHQSFARPGAITLLAVLQFIGGPVLIVSAVAVAAAPAFADTGNAVATVAVAIALLGCGVLELVCGIGLWQLKRYGRTIQLALSWVGLLGFPAGTLISIVILMYLYRPGVKLLFSERSASELTAEEAAEIAAVSRGSLGSVVAVAGIAIIVVAVTGIAAALAIPGLLRARMSGNEAAAIGALRAINLAQGRYAERCMGFASDLSALRRTGQLVSSEWLGDATVIQNGYKLSVEPEGTAIVVRDPPAGCDGTVSRYFAHADPETVGTTGTRFFATDAAGTIYQSTVASIRNPIPGAATPVP